jgi:hypothetical protein
MGTAEPPPIDLTRPHVGDQVHYVSYGTPGGEYKGGTWHWVGEGGCTA